MIAAADKKKNNIETAIYREASIAKESRRLVTVGFAARAQK
jgi:hypothetical protein